MPARLTLEECQKHAESKGGKCLSTEYINRGTKMKWECKEGHQWEVAYNGIKNNNNWCPYCAKCVKLTLEECQKHAESKEGKCLSTVYINLDTKMLWECKENHQWWSNYTNIKHGGNWCPYCSQKVKLTLEECQKHAESKGGKCLSKEYINNQTKMLWECKEGHQWENSFGNIKSQNNWCPYCVKLAKLTLEECQKHAESKEGKCLSIEYINNQTKMLWECKKGHQWETNYASLKYIKSWCPHCNIYRSEELCRKIIEKRLNSKFTKCRPFFLEGLELDGYNDEHKIAFEYNGKQHYEYISFFHRNGIEDFYAQQERDRRKEELCKENCIQLIIIPYTYNYTNIPLLVSFIENELYKKDLWYRPFLFLKD